MRVLFFQAGLGNQMFQYAFLKFLKHNGVDSYVNSQSRGMNCHNGYELENVFPVIREELKDQKCNAWIISVFLKYLAALRNRIKFPFPGLLYEDKNNRYNAKSLVNKWIFIGFFQKAEFAQAVRNELINDFKFKDFDPAENEAKQVAQAIESTPNTVSIHVRRGDYLLPKYYTVYGSVCNLAYYQDAIAHIKSQIPNPQFYVFSNDPQWVKDNLPLDHAVYVNCNTKENSFRDMHLMSLCNHHIIANSSFSWWGAWLNPSPDKMVIAPSLWFNRPGDTVAEEILPQAWIKIPVEPSI